VAKEALGDGIVPAISLSAQAARDFVLGLRAPNCSIRNIIILHQCWEQDAADSNPAAPTFRIVWHRRTETVVRAQQHRPRWAAIRCLFGQQKPRSLLRESRARHPIPGRGAPARNQTQAGAIAIRLCVAADRERGTSLAADYPVYRASHARQNVGPRQFVL